MRVPPRTRFTDRSSGESVPGLIRIATEQDLLLWTRWRYRPTDEDRTWDWWAIYLESRASLGRYECYAAVARDDLQGLAVLDLKAKRTPMGQAVTIDYLATNPVNRSLRLGLKHIGLGLIAAAVIRSLEAGARGCLWLESLPGAAHFYAALGMSRQPGSSPTSNLVYILEPTTAEQLLDEIKRQGIIIA